MKKEFIYLPEELHYLGDVKDDLEQKLYKQGTCILNKAVTGCGATTMFLDAPIPTILCSPRKALMFCKANSRRFKDKIYLFRNEKDPDDAIPIDLENRMMEYIRECDNNRIPPKILVSYDSFKYIVRRLMADGSLQRYRIIVDECQAIFTDSSFKGQVDIEFLETLKGIPNWIIFLSATPYLEDYLDLLPEFQSLPYVQLVWHPSSLQPTNIVRKDYNCSPGAIVKRIIKKYRDKGFFEEKYHKGQPVYAREALFFLNNVKAIVGIIQANGLTPADTTVICAIDDKRRKELAEVGFTIGHAPQEREPRTPFTFITRCSFEGTDFWTQAYTYIFSDIAVDSMVLDISLDLPQIMGRQRDDSNPFKYDATFYCKTDTTVAEEKDTYQARIAGKVALSEKWIARFNDSDEDLQMSDIKRIRDCQKQEKPFEIDYVTVIDDPVGGARPVINKLAMCNEIRAWQLRDTTYFNSCQVLRAIDDVTEPDRNYPLTPDFLATFTGDFEQRMKAYCVFLDQYPEYQPKLESLPQIPMTMKEYYRALGHSGIRAESYVEERIRQRIRIISRKPALDAAIIASFVRGQFYSNANVKDILQGIYDSLSFPLTAKATDLEKWNALPVKKVTKTVDGKRVEGYLILEQNA
jgi:hypothetical protein